MKKYWLALGIGGVGYLTGCATAGTFQTASTVGEDNFQFAVEPSIVGTSEVDNTRVPMASISGRYGLSDTAEIGGRLGPGGFELLSKFQLTEPGADGVIVSVAPSVGGVAGAIGGDGIGVMNIGVPLLIGIPSGKRNELVLGPKVVDSIDSSEAWFARLGDQSSTLVAETVIVNDALLPVTNVVVEAVVMEEGNRIRRAHAGCGRPVSDRLIGRLRRDELKALNTLEVSSTGELATGETIRCQVAFARLEPGPDEVVFRIASVEPLPGHSPPLFHPGG